MMRHPATFFSGVVFVAVGVCYLLNAFDVTSVNPGHLWPIFVIAIGAVILLSGRYPNND
jgi:uncharacterized membrane protein HdeD (DUF308 family)